MPSNIQRFPSCFSLALALTHWLWLCSPFFVRRSPFSSCTANVIPSSYIIILLFPPCFALTPFFAYHIKIGTLIHAEIENEQVNEKAKSRLFVLCVCVCCVGKKERESGQTYMCIVRPIQFTDTLCTPRRLHPICLLEKPKGQRI